MKKHIEQSAAFMRSLGLAPDASQLEKLDAYAALVLEKNRDFNLTAAADEREVWLRHLCDGAAALPLLKQLLGGKPAPLVTDAGAGAGYTGITLKILWPEVSVLLLDSLSKRCAFMDWACGKLALASIKAVRLRLGQDKSSVQADAVLERAMGALEDIAGPCASVAGPGGYFIAYRSSPAPDCCPPPVPELLALEQGHSLPLSYRLPEETQDRSFAVYRKRAPF